MSKKNSETIVTFFELLTEKYTAIWFRDSHGNDFMSYTREGVFKTLKIRSNACRDLIYSILRKDSLGSVNKYVLESIINEMHSRTFESEIIKDAWIRYARFKDGSVAVDTINSGVILISAEGVTRHKSMEVPFWQSSKMLPLPAPVFVSRDEFLTTFKRKLNLSNPDEYILALALILKSMVPNSGANPILVLSGSQGSAKTTTSNFIKSLIDPTSPMLFSLQPILGDLVVTAISTWFLAFDNVSWISHELSDLFCGISTGSGTSKRGLHTDDIEKSYSLCRPVLFNGIDELTTRPDFLDRAILLHLKQIDPASRKSQFLVEEEFARDYASLLGGLYQLLSDVLKVLPGIRTDNLPRMTEYARFGIALEKVLGLEDGQFMQAYEHNSQDKSESAFWNDEVCNAIFKVLYRKSSSTTNSRKFNGLEGSISEIKNKLSEGFGLDKKGPKLPSSTKAFSGHLKRIEPLLNSKGIVIERNHRTATKRLLRISLNEEGLKRISETDINVFEDSNDSSNLESL